MTEERPVAVVTGASAGIGEATARRLAQEGFAVVLGARRIDRIGKLAAAIGDGARALELDVTSPASVRTFCDALDRVDLLVNNAGLAMHRDAIAEGRDEDWRVMWETNVLGLVRMTRELLPKLEASGRGHIINLGSTAGFQVIELGSGYVSTKHAVRAVTDTLRLELVGKPIRVSEVSPGLVETEFAVVRFDGDTDRAAKFYEGLDPLTGEDIADVIAWVATRPPNVNIDQVIVKPIAQADIRVVHRRPRE